MSAEALSKVVGSEKTRACLELFNEWAGEMFEKTGLAELRVEFWFPDGSGFRAEARPLPAGFQSPD